LSAIANPGKAKRLRDCKFCSKSPSSGDCEVAAERVFSQQEGLQFDSEMAAPDLRLRTPTGTGAGSSIKSANGSRASRRFGTRNQGRQDVLPPVGRRSAFEVTRPKPILIRGVA